MPRSTLVLMRHARAEAAGELGDHARPLALAGRRQAARTGEQLAQELPTIDVALVSDALRTRETFKLLAAAHPAMPTATACEELYLASPRGILACLAGLDATARRVLVVGHEPGMSSLTAWLARELPGSAASLATGMATGEAAVLAVSGEWSDLARGTARLDAVLRPG